ncbi:MAG: GNAT family protein, partial [Bacteroidota bacterium]
IIGSSFFTQNPYPSPYLSTFFHSLNAIMLAQTYKIETERLIIRCYQPEDAPLLKQAIDESLSHLLPWMPWAKHEPEPLKAKVARLRKYRGQFDLGIDFTFGIFSKDEKVLIGSTGLHTRLDEHAREIGYWINANYLRRGYALEAVTALTIVGFELEGLDRIEIHCAPNNIRSQGIPQKLGYVHEATLKNRTTGTEGKQRDVMIWTMFKEVYLKSRLKDLEIKAFNVMNERISI